jgi:peptidyl-tRNA hydrolase, PTH1 family
LPSVRLIVGLGNPGEEYRNTRHNFGFLALEGLARRHGWSFVRNRKLKGHLAKGRVGEEDLLLLLPETYMNSSGESVGKVARYYGIEPQELLVVCDDIALPFGQLRLRPMGGSGGHNGLKSVQAHLGTQEYPRLRIGIERGDPRSELADYVLDRFSREEGEQLEKILEGVADILEKLVAAPLEQVMKQVNTQ